MSENFHLPSQFEALAAWDKKLRQLIPCNRMQALQHCLVPRFVTWLRDDSAVRICAWRESHQRGVTMLHVELGALQSVQAISQDHYDNDAMDDLLDTYLPAQWPKYVVCVDQNEVLCARQLQYL